MRLSDGGAGAQDGGHRDHPHLRRDRPASRSRSSAAAERGAVLVLHGPLPPGRALAPIPVPGVVAMVAALGTLVVNFVDTHMYEQKHRSEEEQAAATNGRSREEIAAALLEDARSRRGATSMGGTGEATRRTPCTLWAYAHTPACTCTAMRTGVAHAVEEGCMTTTPMAMDTMKSHPRLSSIRLRRGAHERSALERRSRFNLTVKRDKMGAISSLQIFVKYK